MWMVSQWWSPVSPTLENSKNLSHWPILHGTKVKRDLFYRRQEKIEDSPLATTLTFSLPLLVISSIVAMADM